MEKPQVNRSSNFSRLQVDMLLDSLEACPQLNTGEIGGKIPSKHHQKLAWEAVAQKLSEEGPERTGDQVKAKWIDLKYRTRQKVRRLRGIKGTDDISKNDLTDTEIRVLYIMGIKPSPGDRISSEELEQVKAISFITANEGTVVNADDTLNDSAEQGSYQRFLQETRCDFSEDDESNTAIQVKLPDFILPFPKKRSSSAERVERWRKKKYTEEREREDKVIATQEKMAMDIEKIKLCVTEMKTDMNMYMKRMDQKFDKMLDLLAVALNVEPHDINMT